MIRYSRIHIANVNKYKLIHQTIAKMVIVVLLLAVVYYYYLFLLLTEAVPLQVFVMQIDYHSVSFLSLIHI